VIEQSFTMLHLRAIIFIYKNNCMKSLMSKLLLSVALVVFLFGCKKSDNETPPPVDTPVKSVKQISATPTDFVAYEYDSNGRVTKHTSQWDNGAGGLNKITTVYEYDGNKLTRSSSEAGHSMYTYSNNQIEKSEHFAINGKKLSTLNYTFNGGKLVTVLEQIANPRAGDVTETKISYQYYNNGNVSRIDFAHRKEITDPFVVNFSKIFVEYDNKINPEPDGVIGFFIPGVVMHINNPVKVNNLQPNGTVDGYVRYEYLYNSVGLPIERKHFVANGTVETPPVTWQYVY
jgi:hypothetical protein